MSLLSKSEQRREIEAATSAKSRRDMAAMCRALHNLRRHFGAAGQRRDRRRRRRRRQDTPAAALPDGSAGGTHDDDSEDGLTKVDGTQDEDGTQRAYESFGDLCTSELGLCKSAAEGAIKEALIARLFCDTVLVDAADRALAARVASSSYRCLIALVSDWSAPVEWMEWSMDELTTWFVAPARSDLCRTFVSVWNRAKAKAGQGGPRGGRAPSRRHFTQAYAEEKASRRSVESASAGAHGSPLSASSPPSPREIAGANFAHIDVSTPARDDGGIGIGSHPCASDALGGRGRLSLFSPSSTRPPLPQPSSDDGSCCHHGLDAVQGAGATKKRKRGNDADARYDDCSTALPQGDSGREEPGDGTPSDGDQSERAETDGNHVNVRRRTVAAVDETKRCAGAHATQGQTRVPTVPRYTVGAVDRPEAPRMRTADPQLMGQALAAMASLGGADLMFETLAHMSAALAQQQSWPQRSPSPLAVASEPLVGDDRRRRQDPSVTPKDNVE